MGVYEAIPTAGGDKRLNPVGEDLQMRQNTDLRTILLQVRRVSGLSLHQHIGTDAETADGAP